MRTILLSLFITAPLAVVGCSKHSDAPPAADNTAKNQRDTDRTPTADQAAQSGTDLELTAKIRQALVAAAGLSTNAMNAKVVVDQGVVTLVGPVASAEERTRVASIASDAGAARVINQLEIAN
jgi:hyperosmotically inducible periplasmic protein